MRGLENGVHDLQLEKDEDQASGRKYCRGVNIAFLCQSFEDAGPLVQTSADHFLIHSIKHGIDISERGKKGY